jgi:hypothetical protein
MQSKVKGKCSLITVLQSYVTIHSLSQCEEKGKHIFTKTFKITCFSGNMHPHITVLFKSVEEFVRAQIEKKCNFSLNTFQQPALCIMHSIF